MEEKKAKKAYTKSRLVKELSWKAQLPQEKVKEVLAALAEIACREAYGSFVLPGLCKFDVVRRKARKIRNPRTGEILVLPEHDALRISAARAAKLAIGPKVTAVPLAEAEKAPETAAAPEVPAATEAPTVQETPAAPEMPAVSETPAAPEAPAAPETPAADTAAPAATEPEKPLVKPEGPVSFRCPQCHQEVEAPGEMAGESAECPICGFIFTVPYESEAGTIHGAAADGATAAAPQAADEQKVVSASEAAEMYPAAFKNKTIRINAEDLGLEQPKVGAVQMVSFRCPQCRQEIEASQDMVGEAAQCPNCGMMLVVPRTSEEGTLHSSAGEAADPRQLTAMKSRTMRIDMPDDF